MKSYLDRPLPALHFDNDTCLSTTPTALWLAVGDYLEEVGQSQMGFVRIKAWTHHGFEYMFLFTDPYGQYVQLNFDPRTYDPDFAS